MLISSLYGLSWRLGASTPACCGSAEKAERGFKELADTNLLLTKTRKVPDRRHPAGRREETWRALAHPFSTSWRAHLQALYVAAARGVDTEGTM